MKRRLPSLLLLILLVSGIFSCTRTRHHRDEHRKYRVLEEDSIQRMHMEDHMRDNQPH